MRGASTEMAIPVLRQHPSHREEIQHHPWGVQTPAELNLVLMPSNIQETDTLTTA